MEPTLFNGKGRMPSTDRKLPAFASSASRFEDSPSACALPLPKGFEPSSPNIKLEICLRLLECIEELPSTISTVMKDDLCSSTEFINWTVSPSPETDDMDLAMCMELHSFLNSLPQKIRDMMVKHLTSIPELISRLTKYNHSQRPIMSTDPEEDPGIPSRELAKYLDILLPALNGSIRESIAANLTSALQDECLHVDDFRQAVCTELLKGVNSLLSPIREEMTLTLLLQTKLMRYLDTPSRATPSSSTSNTAQDTQCADSPSVKPQQVPQRVEHDDREVEITEEEQREMVAIAEEELENAKSLPSPTQTWDRCAAKRSQSPPQQHGNESPKPQAPRVDKYGRDQPPVNATPSEIWAARAKDRSPSQPNNRQLSKAEVREVDKHGNQQSNRHAIPAGTWRAKSTPESPPRNNSRQWRRTETARTDKYGRVQPSLTAKPAEIWAAKAKNQPVC